MNLGAKWPSPRRPFGLIQKRRAEGLKMSISIKKASKALVFLGVSALTLNSALAYGSPAFVPIESSVVISRDSANAYRIGQNVTYPIQYRLKSDVSDNYSDFSINNGENSYKLNATSSGVLVEGYLDLSQPTSIFLNSSGATQPIPVLLSTPLDLGKVTFGYASSKLNESAISVIETFASEISKSNINGIYLVGNADRTGSVEANFAISLKRAKAVKKALLAAMAKLGVERFSVDIENMSNFLAKGKDGVKNEADRNVTFMLYPIVR